MLYIDENKNYKGTLKEVGFFIRFWQLSMKKNNVETDKLFVEFKKLLEEIILPNGFNMVIFNLTQLDLLPFVNLAHKYGLKVLIYICNDEALWMIIPKTYEYVKKYGIDGILVERPSNYFNETLQKILPDIELQSLVTCEKYQLPWINCNQNMEMYQENMNGPLFKFIIEETNYHDPMSLLMFKEIMERSINSSNIVGFHLYGTDIQDYTNVSNIIGNELKSYNIKPERFVFQKNKVIKESLSELLDDYYQVGIYVKDLEGKIHSPIWFFNPEGKVEADIKFQISREDRIHSPFWTKDPLGKWEWGGVFIPGGAYRRPQEKYKYFVPKKFLKNGTLKIKLDPTYVDASRPLYALHSNSFYRWQNYSSGDCLIKAITLEIPSLEENENEIDAKILGKIEYKDGFKIDEYVPTIIDVSLE
ncbi:MAG: hypothetical protein ABIB46_03625 [bacterium]